MGSSKFNEPAAGSSILADKVGGAAIFGYRDIEFAAWSDIAYKSVAAPGTAEQAQSSTACRGLFIVAHPLNAGKVAIGPSSSTKATDTLAAFRGLPVYPGQAIPVPVNNTNLVYVDNLSGDKWALVYFTHTDS